MATALTVVADPKRYVWWFPGSPVKVHLDLQMVQRLKDRLQDFGTGAAEEGLLFGRTVEGAVEILDFQPASNASVTSMIAALPNEQGKHSLMGYYRTEQGETFHLNAKDVSLAEECFRKPYHVFLMIHSNGFGSPNATFFFRDGDRKMADFAFLEFPLDPSLLAIEERDRIQRSHQAAAVTNSVEVPSLAPAPSATRSPRNHSSVVLKAVGWMFSLAMVFALGALVNNSSFRTRFANLRRAILNPPAVNSSSSSVSQPSSLPLIALHAKRQNGDLELTWNRESALIATATSGVITIQDGPSESKRQIALDSTQVRGGSLLYSPTSDQILMQLTVTTPADTVTESVMVVLPKAGSLHTYPLPSSEPASASMARPQAPMDRVPLVTASKPFTQPLAAKGSSSPSPPILTDSPPLKLDLYPATTVMPGIVSQTPVRLPPPPVTTSQPPPAMASQQHAPANVRYQPAVAIAKVSPHLPPEVPAGAVREKVIEVKVTIDKNGKVSKAEAIPQNNVSLFLINSAVNAARLWKFRPALKGDEPVPSEAFLRFVFGH